jgi:hypothetical protein
MWLFWGIYLVILGLYISFFVFWLVRNIQYNSKHASQRTAKRLSESEKQLVYNNLPSFQEAEFQNSDYRSDTFAAHGLTYLFTVPFGRQFYVLDYTISPPQALQILVDLDEQQFIVADNSTILLPHWPTGTAVYALCAHGDVHIKGISFDHEHSCQLLYAPVQTVWKYTVPKNHYLWVRNMGFIDRSTANGICLPHKDVGKQTLQVFIDSALKSSDYNDPYVGVPRWWLSEQQVEIRSDWSAFGSKPYCFFSVLCIDQERDVAVPLPS